MTRVRLKGLKRVSARLADGSHTTYWYAWVGGPRLPGKPGSPEFIAAFNDAVADRRTPNRETLAGLVTTYRASPEFKKNAASTIKEWSRWLDRISTHALGQLTFDMLDDKRARGAIMEWRDEYSATPRAADYGLQVLSRILAFGVDKGELSANRATGIKHLWDADRADQIWDNAMLAKFAGKAPPPVSQALRLACLTGLRRGDLIKLRWAEVGEFSITIPTSKSRGKKSATIPLIKEARDLLAEIGRGEATSTVLRNARGASWGANSLSHRITEFAEKAGIERSLHDARGTFATRLRLAGLTLEEIAEVMGWERERVSRILTRYVDQETIVKALIRRVAAAENKAS